MPSVAVIGASSAPQKFGNKAVRAYLRQGWTVYPVNPNEKTVEGLTVFPIAGGRPRARSTACRCTCRPRSASRCSRRSRRRRPTELFLNPGSESDELVERATRSASTRSRPARSSTSASGRSGERQRDASADARWARAGRAGRQPSASMRSQAARPSRGVAATARTRDPWLVRRPVDRSRRRAPRPAAPSCRVPVGPPSRASPAVRRSSTPPRPSCRRAHARRPPARPRAAGPAAPALRRPCPRCRSPAGARRRRLAHDSDARPGRA